jgi:hypothetical protein
MNSYEIRIDGRRAWAGHERTTAERMYAIYVYQAQNRRRHPLPAGVTADRAGRRPLPDT